MHSKVHWLKDVFTRAITRWCRQITIVQSLPIINQVLILFLGNINHKEILSYFNLVAYCAPNTNKNSIQWKNLWHLKHWPKFTLLPFLLTYIKTLTWDKIQRPGFISPLIFILCHSVI